MAYKEEFPPYFLLLSLFYFLTLLIFPSLPFWFSPLSEKVKTSTSFKAWQLCAGLFIWGEYNTSPEDNGELCAEKWGLLFRVYVYAHVCKHSVYKTVFVVILEVARRKRNLIWCGWDVRFLGSRPCSAKELHMTNDNLQFGVFFPVSCFWVSFSHPPQGT